MKGIKEGELYKRREDKQGVEKVRRMEREERSIPLAST